MMQAAASKGIPSSLAGAIALLKQTANPVAPGPGGTPVKSVVGALMDDAERSAAPAGGIAGLGDTMPAGGTYGAAENVRNALPILAQNQQDAQAEQIAQRVRQMNAEDQGIARMAPPMQFDDGGIVGYSGENSAVGQLVEAHPFVSIFKALQDFTRGIIRKKEAEELNKEVEAAKEEARRGTREVGSDLRRPASQDPRVARGTVLQDTNLGTPARAPAAPAAPAPAAAPAEPEITPPTAPTITDIQQLYTQLGLGATEPRMLPAAMEQVKKRMAERPTSEKGIAAIERAAQEREEAAPMDRLRRMFQGWAQSGLGGPEVAQFDEMLRASRVADARAIDAAKRADYALAMGDDKTYAELAAKADDDAARAAQLKTVAYNSVMSFLSDKFKSEAGIFGMQERVAAQRDIAAAKEQMQRDIAAAKAAGNKPLEMTLGDKLKLLERVNAMYPVGKMTPDLKQYVTANVPNGAQLVKDYEKDPNNSKWAAMLGPLTERARAAEMQKIVQGTRAAGAAQPRPYTDFLR